PTPVEIVLVDPSGVTPDAVASLKKDRFTAVALVLDEASVDLISTAALSLIREAGLDWYYWIEVARNPALANAHPRWMAALGMHRDWLKNFPKTSEPGPGEVAKAYPWVPIAYREAFQAHLDRIGQLLRRAPAGSRGLFLNDLQGGP